MFFVVVLILIALLALCVFMLMKDGDYVLPGTSAPAAKKTDEESSSD